MLCSEDITAEINSEEGKQSAEKGYLLCNDVYDMHTMISRTSRGKQIVRVGNW